MCIYRHHHQHSSHSHEHEQPPVLPAEEELSKSAEVEPELAILIATAPPEEVIHDIEEEDEEEGMFSGSETSGTLILF